MEGGQFQNHHSQAKLMVANTMQTDTLSFSSSERNIIHIIVISHTNDEKPCACKTVTFQRLQQRNVQLKSGWTIMMFVS